MIIFEIIGFLSVAVAIFVLLSRAYRIFFGFSPNNCPNNHDTMARYGVKKCNKCGEII